MCVCVCVCVCVVLTLSSGHSGHLAGIGRGAGDARVTDSGGAGVLLEVAGVRLSRLKMGKPRDGQRDLREEEKRRGGEREIKMKGKETGSRPGVISKRNSRV